MAERRMALTISVSRLPLSMERHTAERCYSIAELEGYCMLWGLQSEAATLRGYLRLRGRETLDVGVERVC